MDLIVGRFADVYIDKFDEPALEHFERLIEVPNAELYAWVTGDETAPPEHDNAVLRQLIGFHAGSRGGPHGGPHGGSHGGSDAQIGQRSGEGR
jgi:antitoxin CptB